MDDDLPVKKKTTHEIGQDLSLLSIGELTERITLLEEEIARHRVRNIRVVAARWEDARVEPAAPGAPRLSGRCPAGTGEPAGAHRPVALTHLRRRGHQGRWLPSCPCVACSCGPPGSAGR